MAELRRSTDKPASELRKSTDKATTDKPAAELRRSAERPSINVAIVGSRDYHNGAVVFNYVDDKLKKYAGHKITIVSGGAQGVDRIAEDYAAIRGYDLHVIKPNYEGTMPGSPQARARPLQRNSDIVAMAHIIIAFPTETSRGTFDTISKARRAGKEPFVCNV